MLENASEPSLGVHLYSLAAYILTLDHNLFGAPDIFTDIAGNTEAPFYPQHLTLGFDDLRIDHGYLVVFKLGDKNADGLRNLRCGQSHTARCMHCLEHILGQLLDRWVETMYFLCFATENRILCCNNFMNCHKRCFLP